MSILINISFSWKIYLFILVIYMEGCVGCIFRSSSWNSVSSIGQTPPTNLEPLATGKTPLTLDKDTVSVIEQTLVKTLIAMGKLKFHCPRDDGSYPDMLDCQKYYKCTAGNYTTHECEDGTGFEPSVKSCVKNESVSLCQRVQRLDNGHVCNTTGLETMTGSCNKFILCTGEAAFASSCNKGDLFDQRLKLCLPEKEANCDGGKGADEIDYKLNTTLRY